MVNNKEDFRKKRKDFKKRNDHKGFHNRNNNKMGELVQGKDKYPDVRDDQHPANDPDWYAVNAATAKAVGNLPYNIFPGMKVDIAPKTGVQDNSAKCVPGVMALNYVAAPGRSTSGSSPINIASKAFYSWIRHANSGHTNYESSDLTVYLLAMDAIYTTYLEAKRIYETAMTYTFVNRNIPDLLLKAMKVQPDGLRANLAQFRYGLNILAAKISSMAVPKTFNVFKRHAIISSAVFTDSDSQRGQYYVYSQDAYLKYDPTMENGGGLRAQPISWNRTWQDILNQLEELVNIVISDEDMNIMSGDILKAYDKDMNNLFALPQVDEEATMNLIFDENILNQIENSTCEGLDWSTQFQNWVYQEDNIIKCNPNFDYTNYSDRHYFNSHKNEPSEYDNLEYSRAITFNGYFGTEVLTRYALFYYSYDNQGIATLNNFSFDTYMRLSDTSTTLIQKMQTVGLISMFDWHPIIYFMHDIDASTKSIDGIMGDLKKFTVLSTSEIERLHDSAVMGEFNTQLLERFSK